MSHHWGSRIFRASAVPASFVAGVLILVTAAMPCVARADTKQFVFAIRGDAFDAAAAAAAQSANPTIAKIRVEESGLVLEDNSLPNRLPPVWSDSSTETTRSVFSASSNSSDEKLQPNWPIAYDINSNQGASHDSTAWLWEGSFYSGGGFYFYPGVPGLAGSSGELLNDTGSDRIDLGSGHPSENDLNSADGSGTSHNGVASRTKSPLRVLTGQAVAAPEPSSLLMLGCGVFAVGLKRKYLRAK